jgi:hypothetical protein
MCQPDRHASYDGDPADNQYQKGFLAALVVVRDEAFTGCNSHADLVKALEEIATGCDDEHLHPFNSVWAELIKSRARAALATLTARKVG